MKFLRGDFTGRHVMLLNIYYNRGSYNSTNDDVLDIIYKDMDTGKKYVETIVNPKIEVWIVKPEFRNYKHIRDFMLMEQCDRVMVHYKTRFAEIGQKMGISADEAKTSPYVMQADIKIEHFYLIQFNIEYHNDEHKTLDLGFLDIENDIIQCNGFPQPGEAPVNAVTYICQRTKNAYTLVLAKDNLPVVGEGHPAYENIEATKEQFYQQVDAFAKGLDDGSYFEELHQLFDDSYGELHYHVELFDDEVILLTTLWDIVRHEDDDYILVWNLPYDATNLIERAKALGYDPVSIIMDDRFRYPDVKREIYFKEDTNPLIQKRRHESITYTTASFVDQMVEYVGIRSGKGKLPSAKLNAIGKAELGDEKLDYSEVANIKTLFYVDFKKFITYNLKDVLLQLGIESKVHDMDTVYSRLTDNYVLLNESFVSTAVVLNSVRAFAYEHGQIMGYNKNRFKSAEDAKSIEQYAFEDPEFDDFLGFGQGVDEDEDEEVTAEDSGDPNASDPKKRDKYAGAFVMNPLHMKSTGFKVLGRETNYIHNLMADLDIGSEYPTAFIIMNASNETMVGKVFIDNPEDLKVQMYNIFKFRGDDLAKYKLDPGGYLVELLSENDPFDFGEIVLNLPSPEDTLSDIKKILD